MAFPSLSCQELLYHEIIKGSKGSPEEMRLAGMETSAGKKWSGLSAFQETGSRLCNYVRLQTCVLGGL